MTQSATPIALWIHRPVWLLIGPRFLPAGRGGGRGITRVTPQVRAEQWPRHLTAVREEGQLCFSSREWTGFGRMGFGGHVGNRRQPLQEAAPQLPFLYESFGSSLHLICRAGLFSCVLIRVSHSEVCRFGGCSGEGIPRTPWS